jgi:hypothetical protein
MLSTKNLTGKGLPKSIQPGNQAAKINEITLEPGFDEGSYFVILHLEGEDLGEGFEGFLINKAFPNGPRYKGQIGRVKLTPYAFSSGEHNGHKFDRDLSILSALKNLAIALGKQQQLNEIESKTIEQYIPLASEVLSSDTFLRFCIGGREYLNKDGYVNYDLFLPKNTKEGVAYESLQAARSRLYPFDPTVHIRKRKSEVVPEFKVPTITNQGFADFDLD